MKIIISNKAKFDIQDIFHYIATDSPQYAKETYENIDAKIQQLNYSPYIGKYVPELKDKYYRELIYKSYRIIYYISENKIYINSVIHSSRNFYNAFYVHNF